MKSPWRIVAQLVSRRRVSDEAPETATDAKGNGDALKPLSMPAPELPPAEDIEFPSGEGEFSDVEPTAPADAERETRDTQLEQRGTETKSSETIIDISAVADVAERDPISGSRPTDLVEPSPPQKSKAVKKRLTLVEDSAAAPDDVALPQRSPADTRHENPLTDLDAEIVQLRKLLAEKLRQQNAQLRALLKRYDIE